LQVPLVEEGICHKRVAVPLVEDGICHGERRETSYEGWAWGELQEVEGAELQEVEGLGEVEGAELQEVEPVNYAV